MAEKPPLIVRYSAVQLSRTRELLSRIEAARRAARFYPPQYPLSQETVARLYDTIRAYHRENVDIQLTFFDGEALLGEQLLLEDSVLFDGLIRDLAESGGRSFLFMRGLTPLEARAFVRCLALPAAELKALGGIGGVLSAEGVEHIRVDSVGLGEVAEGSQSTHGAYADAVTLLHEVDRQSRFGGTPDVRKTTRVVRSLVDNVLKDRSAMLRLTGLHDHDQYTFYHSANVAVLSVALGSMISRDHRFLSVLGVAGILHDVGKLAMSREIVNKPGSLSQDEWREMRAHPVIGAQMVAAMPGIDKAAVVAVLEHHQRFDGRGYPKPLIPGKQHLVSRVIAIADAYDAMTSRRSYSAARMHDHALSLIASSSGSAFDPTLVQLLAKMLGVYPPRSVVRLTDERLGIVLEPSTLQPLEPVVRVVADSDSRLVEPYDIALEGRPEVKVKETIDPRSLNIEVDDYV